MRQASQKAPLYHGTLKTRLSGFHEGRRHISKKAKCSDSQGLKSNSGTPQPKQTAAQNYQIQSRRNKPKPSTSPMCEEASFLQDCRV